MIPSMIFAGSIYSFEQIRKEMDYIRGKSGQPWQGFCSKTFKPLIFICTNWIETTKKRPEFSGRFFICLIETRRWEGVTFLKFLIKFNRRCLYRDSKKERGILLKWQVQ